MSEAPTFAFESGPKVVALGGGHGLAATLRALRYLTPRITAIVTVADDGGSSGRLRTEFGILPPGDLRMALAALCADDSWGRAWADVVQHRFSGDGEIGGHSLGNLMLAALWDMHDDWVVGLDRVAELLRVVGRVLPMAATPLEICALVRDPQSGVVEEIRGQVAVATAKGNIVELSLNPADPPARPEAITAILDAEWITIGPGSWYSSVLPHLLVPAQREALIASKAKKIVLVNLDARPGEYPFGEAGGQPPEDHLALLAAHAPGLRLDVVVADPTTVSNLERLSEVAGQLGATVIIADLAEEPGSQHHDSVKLSRALNDVFEGRA
ncbi:MAG TPA: uridine diphosphate-N-acetylglucosamine-binding protein YvcK [Candidatus Nanopelagicaceae bacterium]|nr:uridine diphosphate-N-acetylglucosamine-binding protein YvcK [Candidatus Nanopelagicaceae bacterium]